MGFRGKYSMYGCGTVRELDSSLQDGAGVGPIYNYGPAQGSRLSTHQWETDMEVATTGPAGSWPAAKQLQRQIITMVIR